MNTHMMLVQLLIVHTFGRGIEIRPKKKDGWKVCRDVLSTCFVQSIGLLLYIHNRSTSKESKGKHIKVDTP